MDEKKEIGRKIWELFVKGYSYSRIANELRINKSVVSNIINYSLPPKDWCVENVKKMKEQEKQNIKLLKQNCVNLINSEKEKVTKRVVNYSTALFFFAISFLISLNDYYFDFLRKMLNIKSSVYLIIAVIATISVITTIYYFLLKNLIKESN